MSCAAVRAGTMSIGQIARRGDDHTEVVERILSLEEVPDHEKSSNRHQQNREEAPGKSRLVKSTRLTRVTSAS